MRKKEKLQAHKYFLNPSYVGAFVNTYMNICNGLSVLLNRVGTKALLTAIKTNAVLLTVYPSYLIRFTGNTTYSLNRCSYYLSSPLTPCFTL